MILHSALQRRSGPSVVSLLIFQNDLSSQENVTLPCQLCLRLPPPPTVSLSLSLLILLSDPTLPSPLFPSYHVRNSTQMLRSKIPSDISAQIQTASHDHKPRETLRDQEETKDKLLLPSLFFSDSSSAGKSVPVADRVCGFREIPR